MVKTTARTLAPQDVVSLGDGYYRLTKMEVNDNDQMVLWFASTTLDEATIWDDDLLKLVCPKNTPFDLY